MNVINDDKCYKQAGSLFWLVQDLTTWNSCLRCKTASCKQGTAVSGVIGGSSFCATATGSTFLWKFPGHLGIRSSAKQTDAKWKENTKKSTQFHFSQDIILQYIERHYRLSLTSSYISNLLQTASTCFKLLHVFKEESYAMLCCVLKLALVRKVYITQNNSKLRQNKIKQNDIIYIYIYFFKRTWSITR